MKLPTYTARKILVQLGYEVVAFNDGDRYYHVERRNMAKNLGLPVGGLFKKEGLKQLCIAAVGAAGCTAA